MSQDTPTTPAQTFTAEEMIQRAGELRRVAAILKDECDVYVVIPNLERDANIMEFAASLVRRPMTTDRYTRCEARMPKQPKHKPQAAIKNGQCGLPKDHGGHHSLLIPTSAPWFPKSKVTP